MDGPNQDVQGLSPQENIATQVESVSTPEKKQNISIVILIFLVILGISGFLVYYFINKKPSQTNVKNTVVSPTTGVAPAFFRGESAPVDTFNNVPTPKN